MTDTDVLAYIGPRAAAYLDTHGWIQEEEQDPDGRVCLTGALRLCSPRPGDAYLAREVYRKRDRAESWNDAEGRTVDEVRAELTRGVTDADLEATFGPQWRQIVGLVRRAATLTRDDVNRLGIASYAARAAWDAAWAATWDAARDAARAAAWDAARDAAWDAAQPAAWAAAQPAAWAAAGALGVCDLVGQHRLTAEHVETLLAPWIGAGLGDPRTYETEGRTAQRDA